MLKNISIASLTIFGFLNGVVGLMWTRASGFSSILPKKCLMTSKSFAVSVANSFGLKKGTRAPHSLPIDAYFYESVDK